MDYSANYSSFLLEVRRSSESTLDTLMGHIQEKTYRMMRMDYERHKDETLLFPPEWKKASDFDRRLGLCLMALYFLSQKKAGIRLGETKSSAEYKFNEEYTKRYWNIVEERYNNQAIEFYNEFSYDCIEWILRTLVELYPEHKGVLARDFSSLDKE